VKKDTELVIGDSLTVIDVNRDILFKLLKENMRDAENMKVILIRLEIYVEKENLMIGL
jgi:hypothetical protein